MRLTRKKAIEVCILLWTWLAETGKRKENWPEWEKYNIRIAHIARHDYCWLCYYDNHTTFKGSDRYGGGECLYCPYYKKFGYCNNDEEYFNCWIEAKTPHTRKKYAKLFLGQIKTLRSK